MSTSLPHQNLWDVPAPERRGSRRRVWIVSLVLGTVVGGVIWQRLQPPQGTLASPISTLIERNDANTAASMPQQLNGAEAVKYCAQLLREADATLQGVQSVQAVFHKQERIGGALQPQHVMDLKIRREPMCVYLKWHEPDVGQEAIWQEKGYDGQLVVHPGGWKGKLLPMIKLDPHGDRAMEANRRPVTTIGPWNFNRRLIKYLDECQGRQAGEVETVMTDNAKIGGQECYCFAFTHAQPEQGLDFKKVVIYVEKLRKLPIGVENYGWPTAAATELPLEESYVFNDVKLNPQLSDIDFDHANPQYKFVGSK